MNTFTYRTEYAVTYKGTFTGPVFGDLADAHRYIARYVGLGNDPTDYGLQHREVRTGPWAQTTMELHFCPKCGALAHWVAEYGAPGVGSAWRCDGGHELARVGGVFYDPSEGAHILTEEDVR